jgi:transcription initiation factor IIF auxiliary subunit
MKIANVPYITVGTFLLLCFLLVPLTSIAQELSVDNIATSLGNNRWSWTVFVKAPPEVLQNIESVEYTLHPTFPNPVQRVGIGDDPNYPFKLSAIGWGAFGIKIRVFMRDGRVQDLTYFLKLPPPR